MNGPCPLCGGLGRVGGTRCRLCQPVPDSRPLVRGRRLYRFDLTCRALAAVGALDAMIDYATGTQPDRFQAITFTALLIIWPVMPWPRRPSR
jgi:hypothetical protein